MKKSLLSITAIALLLASSGAFAFWGNNGWGNGWNPYDPWDPRYWMEEMEQIWDDDYYGGPYGGPWGGGPYGYGGPWGAPNGYYGAPGYGGGYAPYGYAPYGYAPAPVAPAAPATTVK